MVENYCYNVPVSSFSFLSSFLGPLFLWAHSVIFIVSMVTDSKHRFTSHDEQFPDWAQSKKLFSTVWITGRGPVHSVNPAGYTFNKDKCCSHVERTSTATKGELKESLDFAQR